ncbi:unnamed protein product, partial [Polarella glacialis]
MAPLPAMLRPASGQSDYYEALGISFDAAEEEIRKRYHEIVRTLHPDRRRALAGGAEALERFHQVQSAWRCLSDPTRRLLYDLRNFGQSSVGSFDAGDGAAEELLILRSKEQALSDVRNMEVELDRILTKEKAARGVLVRLALYGDLRLREEMLFLGMSGERAIVADDLVGPLIDVSMPLQCLVERHTLVLPGGAAASKSDLPGFYNPLPLDMGVELSLYVLYEFRGSLHEVIVGDRETLSLPVRRHAIPVEQGPRGPFSPANTDLIRRRISRGPPKHSDSPRKPAARRGEGAEAAQEADRRASADNPGDPVSPRASMSRFARHWSTAE